MELITSNNVRDFIVILTSSRRLSNGRLMQSGSSFIWKLLLGTVCQFGFCRNDSSTPWKLDKRLRYTYYSPFKLSVFLLVIHISIRNNVFFQYYNFYPSIHEHSYKQKNTHSSLTQLQFINLFILHSKYNLAATVVQLAWIILFPFFQYFHIQHIHNRDSSEYTPANTNRSASNAYFNMSLYVTQE